MDFRACCEGRRGAWTLAPVQPDYDRWQDLGLYISPGLWANQANQVSWWVRCPSKWNCVRSSTLFLLYCILVVVRLWALGPWVFKISWWNSQGRCVLTTATGHFKQYVMRRHVLIFWRVKHVIPSRPYNTKQLDGRKLFSCSWLRTGSLIRFYKKKLIVIFDLPEIWVTVQNSHKMTNLK